MGSAFQTPAAAALLRPIQIEDPFRTQIESQNLANQQTANQAAQQDIAMRQQQMEANRLQMASQQSLIQALQNPQAGQQPVVQQPAPQAAAGPQAAQAIPTQPNGAPAYPALGLTGTAMPAAGAPAPAVAPQVQPQAAGYDPNAEIQRLVRAGVLPADAINHVKTQLAINKSVQDLDKDGLELHSKQADIVAGHLQGMLAMDEQNAAEAWPGVMQQLVKEHEADPDELRAIGLDPKTYPGHAAIQQALPAVIGYKNAVDQRKAESTMAEQAATARNVTAEASIKELQQKNMADMQANPAQTLGLVDNVFPVNQPGNAATNQRYKQQLAFYIARGDKAGVDKTMEAMNSEAGTVAKETNPQVQANKIQTAVAEAKAKSPIIIQQAASEAAARQQALTGGAAGQDSTARMIVNGQLDPQTTRAMLRRDPSLMGRVQAADPSFDEASIDSRYNTLREFTNMSNAKPGGQAIAYNKMLGHADEWDAAADALQNGTFVPGNRLYNMYKQAMGSSAPTNADLVARFLAGEAGKVTMGGMPAEREFEGILGNMNKAGSPQQMHDAAQELRKLSAAQVRPLLQRVNDAKLGNVVHLIDPDTKASLQAHGFDPETLQPAGKGGGGMIRARDPQGKLHEAPRGTKLPQGWKLEQ